MKASTKYERARCPYCGRDVATYVPAGGDGSDVKIMPHATPNRKPCPASAKMLGEYERALA